MGSVDFKKVLAELYVPSAKKPVMVNVPKMNFIAIEGVGEPNSSEEFQRAVAALYAVAYGIKMAPKKGLVPPGYFDYVVPPLEGIWTTVDEKDFNPARKDNLKWQLMIMQPTFVTTELFEHIYEQVKDKKGEKAVAGVRFTDFEEGLCAQILHLGPYDEEVITQKRLEAFVDEMGYALVKSGHHEIYLSDPNKCKPEKMKTTLRYPIVAKGE